MDGVRIFFNLTILRDNGPIICPWFTDERSILRSSHTQFVQSIGMCGQHSYHED